MLSIFEIDKNGTKIWRNEAGQLHREAGPAVECADGTKAWYLNGQLHREDGPAYEGSDGTKFWWVKGQHHREDGPAIEWANGSKIWYLNGQDYTFKNYCKELLKRKLITEVNLTLLRLKYGE